MTLFKDKTALELDRLDVKVTGRMMEADRLRSILFSKLEISSSRLPRFLTLDTSILSGWIILERNVIAGLMMLADFSGFSSRSAYLRLVQNGISICIGSSIHIQLTI